MVRTRSSASEAKTPVPTQIHIRAALSAALQQAVREELIHENPVRKTDPPRKPEQRIKYLDPVQVKILAKHIKGAEHEELILAAVYTGMRMSELLGLSWSDIDFEAGRITITRQLRRSDKAFSLAPLKSKASRRNLRVPAQVVELLKGLKGARALAPQVEKPAIPDLIFLTPFGQPMHRKSVLEIVNAHFKAAELPEYGFHALRHTCASLLINGGANPLKSNANLATVRSD